MKYSTATLGTRVRVMPTDTVLQLKEAIYEQDGVPPSQQQLLFNHVVLEDVVSLRRTHPSRVTNNLVGVMTTVQTMALRRALSCT